MTVSRLLDPVGIPTSLWDKTLGVLKLPKYLAEIYVNIVDSKGLRVLGECRFGSDGPVSYPKI